MHSSSIPSLPPTSPTSTPLLALFYKRVLLLPFPPLHPPLLPFLPPRPSLLLSFTPAFLPPYSCLPAGNAPQSPFSPYILFLIFSPPPILSPLLSRPLLFILPSPLPTPPSLHPLLFTLPPPFLHFLSVIRKVSTPFVRPSPLPPLLPPPFTLPPRHPVSPLSCNPPPSSFFFSPFYTPLLFFSFFYLCMMVVVQKMGDENVYVAGCEYSREDKLRTRPRRKPRGRVCSCVRCMTKYLVGQSRMSVSDGAAGPG